MGRKGGWEGRGDMDQKEGPDEEDEKELRMEMRVEWDGR